MGTVTDTGENVEVLFNPATGYEFFHMFLAAYMVTGFLVASVYAVGMLRGRRDTYHRLGFLIPFTVAAIATPIQLFVGDTAARAIADIVRNKKRQHNCCRRESSIQACYGPIPAAIGPRLANSASTSQKECRDISIARIQCQLSL